jgi:hypothetical protein
MPDAQNALTPPAPPADVAAGYRPISALAIAALGVAVLTALIVSAIGIAAKVKGKAILVWPVVGLAVVGLVLAVVARWQIRRSEGTRAGLGLANAAWWLSLLFGCGYAAFLAATELAVRKQAQAIADQWFGFLAAGKPELAFRLTRDPSQQKSIPENAVDIRRRFGATEVPAFVRNDLVSVFRTWKGKTQVNWTGIRELQTTPAGYEADLNYVVRSPEGAYDIAVTALGYDDPATGARHWQINLNKTGIRARQWTRFGAICDELRVECGGRFLHDWVNGLSQSKESPIALLRIDGNVPPEGQRAKLAEELKQPGAINLDPGGPTRRGVMPVLSVDANGARLETYAELTLPSLNSTAIPGHVIVQVTGDDLVKDIINLQGPGWEKQPMQDHWPLQLPQYKFDKIPLKVVEINAQPNGVREVQGPRMMQAPG